MKLIYTYISLLISLLLSLLLLKGFFLGWFTERKKKQYHPISSTVFHQLLNFGRLHHYHTDLARRHTTFRLFGVGNSEIYTANPANVEYMLKTNFTNYAKGTYHYDILSGLLGDGIFAVDGEKWRHQRKIASYEFSTKVLRDSSSVVFRRNAAKLAHIVSDAATSNQEMDMQDLFMKSTLDSIFKVGFGLELNSLCGSSEEGRRFAEAFDESSVLTFWHYVDPLWKLKKRFNIGSEAMLQEKKKSIDEFVYKLIQSKKEQMSGQRDSMEKEDILSRFLALSHEDPVNMNDCYLRDIILNFIIAGKDTTALTLSWFVYMISKNTVVQEKIAREVKEATHAQDSSSIDQFTTSMREEALNKMHHLHAALTETLRLYPPVPVDGKFCLADDTLPDGFEVRKGDMVAYLPYAMGRMKFIWGEDAEVFRPERWIDDDGIFQPESPFKFTAFQAGPRICLGKEFAYRQMKIFAAVLLHFFRFKLSDKKKTVKYRTMITLHIDEGLYVQAYHA
ncbi:cytochrome P450 704C1-like [Magnolia sinica]|uniref:cytochrome P450 704C1-like n=1 Tax=Magnolia sinica TaxID=86752 RepID=UPI002659A3B9|nr:cytochrome P450 704C1-like [Magnolia sinica]